MMVSMRTSGTLHISQWIRWALLAFAFWTAIALVFALPLLATTHNHQRTLLSAMAQWWSWGMLVPMILTLDRALPFTSRQLTRRVLVHLVLGPVLIMVYTYLQACMEALMRLHPWSRLVGRALPLEATREMFWSMLVYCVIVGAWETYQYQQHFLSAELQMERLERTSSDARLNALRMQLDPHFLFNALNTISAHVEREPQSARRMIEHLGDLLRLSLQSHGRQEIPLSKELAFLDHYLAIQMMRFGDKLKIDYEIAHGVRQALVPSLFIQPLVENAIRHGISRRARGGFIQLTAKNSADRLVLRVSDDGVGLPPNWSLEAQTGLGLALTRERIAVLHPNGTSEFNVCARREGGTDVTISFPIRFAEEVSDHAFFD